MCILLLVVVAHSMATLRTSDEEVLPMAFVIGFPGMPKPDAIDKMNEERKAQTVSTVPLTRDAVRHLVQIFHVIVSVCVCLTLTRG